MNNDENTPSNICYDFITKKWRDKENQSFNRNSTQYSSINSVIEKSQQFQHLKLSNGQYWGQLKMSKPNGIGSCHFNNGCFYYGEWKNNVIHGFGIYFFNVGGYIKGEFKEGQANGNCELSYQNGQLYQGNFKEGKQNGIGIKIGRRGKEVVQYKDGIRVCLSEEPQLIEDTQQILRNHLPQIYMHNDRVVYGLQCDLTGLGVIQYNNGRLDMGWFQNGSLNGRGKIIFKSGDIYDGLLKNGFFQGIGFYLNYNSKQLTEGQFERNQILTIQKQCRQYPPYSNDDLSVIDQKLLVDQRILIKNVYLKTRLMIGNKQQQNSSEKKPNKVNKIQDLIQHMLQPVRRTQKSESGQHEEVIDNLLARVQSPQQRKNLEQIISQVTSPQRIR
ncbi:unnamed protein product [Paramecium sonneborni]|uniref:MORN repeat protein n=1 Tax=Paramecium sonneborni TaxID=65129 RepID=A0A8S1QM18_9CILI|nr:unnamed protein product [Paramecium sonneborni]